MSDEDQNPPDPNETSAWRLFIALPLPPPVLSEVADLSSRLQKGFQFTACRPHWLSEDAFHLTLAFLGEQPTGRVETVSAMLTEVAARFPPQRLEIKQLGVFPHWHRPRVLWAGVRDRSRHLTALHAAVNRGLEPLGYIPEARPYHPHLTLARFKSGKGLSAAQGVAHEQSGFRIGPFVIEELVLFRSVLLPEGARHTRLKVHPFSAAPEPILEENHASRDAD